MEAEGCNAKHLRLDVEQADEARNSESWANRNATN